MHGPNGPNIPQADFIAPADNRAIGDTLARLNAQMAELRQQLHNQNVAASQRDQMVSNLAQAFSTLTTSSSGRPNPSTTAARTTDSVPMSGPANNDNNYHGSNSGGKPSKPAPFHGHSGDAHGKTSSNVHTFLFQLEEYFALTREHDDIMRIMIAGTLLRDSAATWYRAVRDPAVTPADRIIRTWSDFCTKLRENFTTVNEVQAARDQLYKLKHGGNVRLFIQQFRTLCMQIPNISHEEKLHMFIKKLPHEIKMFIVTHPYEHDFESAVTMAERLDMNMCPTTARTARHLHLALAQLQHLAALSPWTSMPCALGVVAHSLKADPPAVTVLLPSMQVPAPATCHLRRTTATVLMRPVPRS